MLFSVGTDKVQMAWETNSSDESLSGEVLHENKDLDESSYDER